MFPLPLGKPRLNRGNIAQGIRPGASHRRYNCDLPRPPFPADVTAASLFDMALLPILEFPDPRLRTRAEPVDPAWLALPETQRLLDDMFETMYAAPGIGLAASQVDVHKRFMVIDVSEAHDRPMVFVNPQVTARSGEQVYQEGCLSVPGIFADVTRAEAIMAERPNLDVPTVPGRVPRDTTSGSGAAPGDAPARKCRIQIVTRRTPRLSRPARPSWRSCRTHHAARRVRAARGSCRPEPGDRRRSVGGDRRRCADTRAA